jgi:hypothetical protein
MFPADNAISAPFVRPGTVGSAVSLRYAEVTATRVEGSTCVSAGFAGTPGLRTPGVFVVTGSRMTTNHAGERLDIISG